MEERNVNGTGTRQSQDSNLHPYMGANVTCSTTVPELVIHLNFLSMSTAGSYVPRMEWV